MWKPTRLERTPNDNGVSGVIVFIISTLMTCIFLICVALPLIIRGWFAPNIDIQVRTATDAYASYGTNTPYRYSSGATRNIQEELRTNLRTTPLVQEVRSVRCGIYNAPNAARPFEFNITTPADGIVPAGSNVACQADVVLRGISSRLAMFDFINTLTGNAYEARAIAFADGGSNVNSN